MATQKGRNWSSGDIVTAANLSSIERGVSAVAEEYTPTTWANGNTVTAAALNNIEQGIANAGGGSSDFSTATVRVILQGGTMANICLPFMRRNGSFVCGFTGMDDETVTAVLKDGSAVCMIAGNFDTVTATGSATVTEDYIVTITGDCTITISDSSGGQIAE